MKERSIFRDNELYVLFFILNLGALKFKNNPIFGISVKFPIQWYHRHKVLMKDLPRSKDPEDKSREKKIDFSGQPTYVLFFILSL